ncbi:hypothetical protein Bca52824_027959 [Brassica carinata]|uniref:Uncharacterized protein n=1 Tax=Brassica carinata TaxID=52824 RepID=A0A8X7VBK0_BRACI|nr:hypothetical protein Bca52824_027959 [Brassica carinata]
MVHFVERDSSYQYHYSSSDIEGWNIIPGWDYVQREIEKEQIRREIIAAETARRRELIAEVAQEMAMEREMAIKSIAEKEEKIATWITQRKLSTHQNQNNNNFSKLKRTYSDPAMYTSLQNLVTSPMTQMPPLQQMLEATAAKEKPVLESNKDKLIILDRPDPIGRILKLVLEELSVKQGMLRMLLEIHRLEKEKASTVPVKSLDADPSEEESMVHFVERDSSYQYHYSSSDIEGYMESEI